MSKNTSATAAKSTQNLLTQAHNWLGLIIATVLFIVFLGGTLSFYRTAIKTWEMSPQVEPAGAEAASLESLFTNLQEYLGDAQLHHEHGLGLIISANHSRVARYETELPVTDSNGQPRALEDGEHPPTEYHSPLFSAKTGKFIAQKDPFTLDKFFYDLHFYLKIPTVGEYLVGIITLFYFVVLLTGIIIHWKKILPNFFLVRDKKPRERWLDSHNVIGVISLPYHLMFALTGLIFNLLIIYQAAYVAILYDGNRQALFEDAGFKHHEEMPSEKPLAITDGAYSIDQLVKKAEALDNFKPFFVSLMYPGHDNAIVSVRGTQGGEMGHYSEVRFRLATGEEIYRDEKAEKSLVSKGLGVVHQLHFGDFAGPAQPLIKFIFFLLGLSGLYLIVSGNLLYLDKRAAKRKGSRFGLHFVRGTSIGIFAGSFTATAVTFVLARLLPAGIESRSELLASAFFISVLLATIAALGVSFKKKSHTQLCQQLIYLAAGLFAALPVLDYLIYGLEITRLIQQGYSEIIGMQLGFVAFSGAGFWLGRWIGKNNKNRTKKIQQTERAIEANNSAR